MGESAGVANPVINVSFQTPEGMVSLPVLLDTGAQFSLIDLGKIKHLIKGAINTCARPIRSLSIEDKIEGLPVEFTVHLPGLQKVEAEIFCVSNLHIDMQVNNIEQTLMQLNKNHIPLSPNTPEYRNNSITLYGVIGSDLLHYFSVFELCQFQNAKLLRLTNGFILFGKIANLNLTINKSFPKNKVDRIGHENRFELLRDLDNSIDFSGSNDEKIKKESSGYKRSDF